MFKKVWLLLFVLMGVVLSARLLFVNHSPSLRDVLSLEQTGNPFDLSMMMVALLALSLATLSAAKGYEIFRRSRRGVIEEFKRTEAMLRKNNIALSKECERLKSENERSGRTRKERSKKKAGRICKSPTKSRFIGTK